MTAYVEEFNHGSWIVTFTADSFFMYYKHSAKATFHTKGMKRICIITKRVAYILLSKTLT